MAKWHVLQVSGYADTQADYVTVSGKAAVADELIDLGHLDNPAITVYAGEREPWTEHTPYPDFIVSRGPRDNIKWERA